MGKSIDNKHVTASDGNAMVNARPLNLLIGCERDGTNFSGTVTDHTVLIIMEDVELSEAVTSNNT